ncbi:trypsin-like serine protease [Vibrio parahaemolyticus]|uniref:trypsin-like serine protease n=1 Tax=Vibrio parahaemolyticus TaxID=670 RepID=UPI001E4E9488|nr:trypsin-like serine protease [Vibrio parahaemolyticus]MCD1416965.1 trypsin-like serine protease [Vibrio parahaemolyticus]
MRFSSLSLLALSVFSASSHAVENGTPVDWSQQDNAIRLESSNNTNMYCTATLVSGRYALTAAHCLDGNGIDRISSVSNDITQISQQLMHPNYMETGGFSTEDVGIVKLEHQIDYHNIQFLNIDKHTAGEKLTIAGFGDTIETLNRADFTFSHYYPNPGEPDNPFVVYADMVNDSHTTGGDSGSAWVNKNSEIIAIHKGSTHYVSGERKTYGTDIQAVKDFITDNIDAWHYPTLADTDDNGKATITVQSLHRDIVFDGAWGDNVTITGGTCLDGSPINPFDKCTYDIENDGTQGELYLTDNEVIHINKPIENTGGGDGGNNNTDNDDSGGSMGFWPFLLLGVAVLRRKR